MSDTPPPPSDTWNTDDAWSDEDLREFRAAAQATWPEFADTPEAKALVDSHMAYLTQLGLVSN